MKVLDIFFVSIDSFIYIVNPLPDQSAMKRLQTLSDGTLLHCLPSRTHWIQFDTGRLVELFRASIYYQLAHWSVSSDHYEGMDVQYLNSSSKMAEMHQLTVEFWISFPKSRKGPSPRPIEIVDNA